LENAGAIVNEIFSVRPGTTGGNALDSLDANYLGGKEIEYLAGLPSLLVMNDEAHHIHENKIYGEVKEVEWQKSLNKIAKNKGSNFIQVDFSATPYDVTGSGQNRIKHYFPHIIVDFDLKIAIRRGLVKTIAIDKRKEITDLPLDFAAIREGKEVIGLSDGQKLMIRAGLKKLKILEDNFVEFAESDDTVSDKQSLISPRSIKYPKMLIMCEDTKVTPLVVEFLLSEGLAARMLLELIRTKKEIFQKLNGWN